MLRAFTWVGTVAFLGITVVTCVAQEPDEDEDAAEAALAVKGKDKDKDKGGDSKVEICHIPPGNPTNAHTITVGSAAVKAHLAHGDTLGPCDEPDEGEGGGDDGGGGAGGGSGNTCYPIGVACGNNEMCCSDSCIDGVCTSAIIAGNPDTCVAPDECDAAGFLLKCNPNSPCCGGAHCIFELCQPSEWLEGGTCALVGQACNHLDDQNPKWCCWNRQCVGADEYGNGHCQ